MSSALKGAPRGLAEQAPKELQGVSDFVGELGPEDAQRGAFVAARGVALQAPRVFKVAQHGGVVQALGAEGGDGVEQAQVGLGEEGAVAFGRDHQHALEHPERAHRHEELPLPGSFGGPHAAPHLEGAAGAVGEVVDFVHLLGRDETNPAAGEPAGDVARDGVEQLGLVAGAGEAVGELLDCRAKLGLGGGRGPTPSAAAAARARRRRGHPRPGRG
jgi:hypothetical protein